MKYSILTFSLAFALLGSGAPALAQHDEDIVVGRSPAHQLVNEAPPDVHNLEPVDPGNPFGLTGWSLDEPGLHSLFAEDVVPGQFERLATGASIYLEVVSLEPALKLLDPQQGLLSLMPGQRLLLGTIDNGNIDFDTHPIWYIDSSDPGYFPGQTLWSGVFRTVDLGTTAYTSSEHFSLSFQPVPEPDMLVSIALLGLVTIRQPRS